MNLESHCRMVVKAMARGDVVPLIGAGANLCDRPPGEGWARGQSLPSGAELAQHLAADFDYPYADTYDLTRVSEFVDLSCGGGPLYDSLREVFVGEYSPTSLHRLLASVPGALASADGTPRHLLVVTTNYDTLMEQAFDAAGEPYDVVVYQAEGAHRGRLIHHRAGGEPCPVDRPNEYSDISIEERSVVFKIHGATDPVAQEHDSYVVTEDHYIEFLAHTSVTQLIPVLLLAKMLRSNFLFLGYSLRDWNLRAVLHQIFKERNLDYRSWAIQRGPDQLDQQLWLRRKVDVHDVWLRDYVEELERQLALRGRPPSG